MSLARYLANLLNSSGQVEAAKLAATLDLSSKTLTYPDNSVQSADIASLAASKLSGQVPDANAPSGSVIQVVQTSITTTFGTSTHVWQDITGLSATITPSSSSSKILVLGQIVTGTDSGNLWALRLLRNGSLINFGDASGSAGQGLRNAGYRETNSEESTTIAFLDSPATTSACTYKIQCDTESGYAFYLNRTAGNLNDTRQSRSASNIILLEIAG